MPVYDRKTMPALLKEIRNNTIAPVYLLFGERFLCRQAAEKIGKALCENGGIIHSIDGENEDISATIAKLRSFSLLPGKQIYQVNSSRIFHSKKVTKALWNRAVKAINDDKNERAASCIRAMLEAGGLDSTDQDNAPPNLSAAQWKKCFGFAKPAGNIDWTKELLSAAPQAASKPPSGNDSATQLLTTLQEGIPTDNILMLLAEDVDKRKKLYKFFKKNAVILDLKVDSGSGYQAKKTQQSVLQEQVNTVLRAMNKTMAPQVAQQLFERVGFHPVAVVMETEKLALYVGDSPKITLEDLNTVVGRTRQEALFELTQAIGENKLDTALLVAQRLQENSIHALAIIATLRNFTRKLLLFSSLQRQSKYGFTAGIPPKVFQQQCLPLLKENERWEKELTAHPFAIYMQFTTASKFSLPTLTAWMRHILQAEMRLKGSPVAAVTVIDHLLLSMLKPVGKGNLQNQH